MVEGVAPTTHMGAHGYMHSRRAKGGESEKGERGEEATSTYPICDAIISGASPRCPAAVTSTPPNSAVSFRMDLTSPELIASISRTG